MLLTFLNILGTEAALKKPDQVSEGFPFHFMFIIRWQPVTILQVGFSFLRSNVARIL